MLLVFVTLLIVISNVSANVHKNILDFTTLKPHLVGTCFIMVWIRQGNCSRYVIVDVENDFAYMQIALKMINTDRIY